MPVILPTVAEQQRMSWRALEHARRALAVHVAQVRQQRAALEHSRRVRQAHREWAPEAVRDEARALLAAMPPDPDAAAHRRLLGAS